MTTEHRGAGSVFPGAHLPLAPEQFLSALKLAQTALPPTTGADMPAWVERLRAEDASRPLLTTNFDGSLIEVRLSDARHVAIGDIQVSYTNEHIAWETKHSLEHEGRFYVQTENTPTIEHGALTFRRLPGGLESFAAVAETVRTGIVVGYRFWEFDAEMTEMVAVAEAAKAGH